MLKKKKSLTKKKREIKGGEGDKVRFTGTGCSALFNVNGLVLARKSRNNLAISTQI